MAKKQDITEQFLNTYKELEVVLRGQDPDMTVLRFEEKQLPLNSEKIRICRQIRNYMQHHDEPFLTATPEMVAFIEDVIRGEQAKEETAGDRLYRLAALTLDLKLSEVVQKFAKAGRNWIPVVDGQGIYIGVLTDAVLLKKIAEAQKLSVKAKTVITEKDIKTNIKTVAKSDPLKLYSDTREDLVVTGKDGKYVGVVKW